MVEGGADVVVPFRVPRGQVQVGTEFRSTWLTASLDALRSHGLFERYLAQLPRADHEPVLQSVAGLWLPIRIAQSHYRACESLGLTTAEQLEMGRDVFRRLEKTIFSVVFRAAREVGVTPWSTLRMVPAAFERELRGGACGLFRVGPKDARLEIIGFPCAQFAYCRTALRAMATGLCELVCNKAYAQEIREFTSPTSVAYRVAWA